MERGAFAHNPDDVALANQTVGAWQAQMLFAVLKSDEHALVVLAKAAFTHGFVAERQRGVNGQAAQEHFVVVGALVGRVYFSLQTACKG